MQLGRGLRHRSRDKRGGQQSADSLFEAVERSALVQLGAGYLESMSIRNYSEETVYGHRLRLHFFLQWCELRDLSEPVQITRPILESYQRHLFRYRTAREKPLSAVSQRHYLGTVQGFFRWLCRKHHLLSNPAGELELPRPEKRLPVLPLTVEEVEQIMAQPDVSDSLGLRDRAILELFYSTGLRRSELVRLELSAIDFGRSLVVVRQGKGKKDRVLPLGARAAHWLELYRDQARGELLLSVQEPSFFLSSYGEALNADFVSRMVHNYIKRADIGKSGSCHLFRHTCAGQMLEHGADIRYIQQMLGHANLKATEIYTQVNIHQLQKVHTLTHPGAKK